MQITIFWKGKKETRFVEKAPQFSEHNKLYIVNAKSGYKSFWFRKDPAHNSNNGWRLILGAELSEEIISLMAIELEKLL